MKNKEMTVHAEELCVHFSDILSEDEIKKNLKTRWMAREVHYYEECDSTNVRAAQGAKEGAKDGALYVAEYQMAGRGRRGRSWESRQGGNILMSLMLRPNLEPTKAPMLTLVMAYSIAKALKKMEEFAVQIKWPNDLILNGKKICGILTEMSAEVGHIHHVVIGIGVNVNIDTFAEELQDKATSLLLETGSAVNRAKLVAAIMEQFEEDYEKFLQAEDLSPFVAEYNAMLVNQGRVVRVLAPGNEYDGVAHGITPMGDLLVERMDGEVVEVFAGEVSVRGVYGYV